MSEKGLYQVIISKFEGECPIDIASDISKEYLEAINISIRRQILNGFLDDIILLFRNNKVSYINKETWDYFSDYLEGKLAKKKGAKHKSTYYRDELITLKMIELVMLHQSVSYALTDMIKLDGYGLGIKSIEVIYYENKGILGNNLSIEEVRNWGLDTQSKVNQQRSLNGETAIKFFISN